MRCIQKDQNVMYESHVSENEYLDSYDDHIIRLTTSVKTV